ncbi:MAG: putative hemolysin [Planctomycetota bacterium]
MIDFLPALFALALLALSGTLSASETALFNLDESQVKRGGKRVQWLLSDPREVLISILLGNVLVNLLFFTTATGALAAINPFGGTFGALVDGSSALIAILVLGEILPKSLALRAPDLIAQRAALPLVVFVKMTKPLRRFVRCVMDICLRIMNEEERSDGGVTADTLAFVLEQSAQGGVLKPGEADLLSEIIELGELRVREIMTPRVDVLALDLEDDDHEQKVVLREAVRLRRNWLPVTRGGMDQVVGCVEMRARLADRDKALEALVMPVKYVPEVASVLSLLATLREDRVSEAIVVDEWGGTAGVVSMEDIFEELVGELRVEGEESQPPVVPLGEGRFRVSGGLSIRDWNDRFGTNIVPAEIETVGGYVTALLDRIPRRGDRVTLGGGLACEVHEVRDRRLLTLDLFLEEDPADQVDAAEGRGA